MLRFMYAFVAVRMEDFRISKRAKKEDSLCLLSLLGKPKSVSQNLKSNIENLLICIRWVQITCLKHQFCWFCGRKRL